MTPADLCALELLCRLFPRGFYLVMARRPEAKVSWLPYG